VQYFYEQRLGMFTYAFHNVLYRIGDPPQNRIMAFNSIIGSGLIHQRIISQLYPNNYFAGDTLYTPFPPNPSPLPHPLNDYVAPQQYYLSIVYAVRKVLQWATATNNGYGRDTNHYTILVPFIDRFTNLRTFRRVSWPAIRPVIDPTTPQNIQNGQWEEGYNRFMQIIDDMEEGESPSEQEERIKHAANHAGEPFHPSLEHHNMDTSIFHIIFPRVVTQRNASKNKNWEYFIYDTKHHPKSKDKCIYMAIKDCGYTFEELKEVKEMNSLVDFINNKKLPINIIYNIPEFYENENSPREGTPIAMKLIGHKGTKNMYPLKDEHCKLNYLLQFDNATHTLCYDVTREHIEACVQNIPTLLPNLFMGEYEIVKKLEGKEKPLMIRQWKKADKMKKIPMDHRNTTILVFDFECVMEYLSIHSIVYCCSYGFFNFTELETLDNLENNYNEEDAEDYIKKHCKNKQHFTSVHEMIDDILEYSRRNEDKYILLVGFNNANYDNYMLLEALQTLVTLEDKPLLQYVEYHGSNRIGNLLFNNGKCSTFDLRRHLPAGNLINLCKNFNIKHFSKKPELVCHMDIQKCFLEHHQDNFYENLYEILPEDQLKDYNNFDILSVALLFYRYTKYMRSFDCVKKASELKDLKEPFCYSSLPSYLYSLCTIHLEDNEVIFPKLTHNQYQFIRKSAIAGRIETFDKPPTRYDEEIMSLDVTSMYPYSMFCAPVGFGCRAISQGKMTEAIAEALHSDFNENLDFTHKGYYTVNIDQSNLIQGGKSPFICHKDKAGHNWSSYNIDTIYQNDIVLCTNDIKVLLKLNCSVEFIMGAEYITFSHKIPNFEIFGWMSEFMTKKNFQSMQPKNLQNASELSICKIALNSMSGKFMQRIYEMIRVQIRNHHYLSYISQSKDMIPDSESVVGCINRDMCVIEYKRKPECITNIKPIQVGADIYSFSREYMYLNLIHPLGIRASLYTDTDSVKLLARDYIYIKNILEPSLYFGCSLYLVFKRGTCSYSSYKACSNIFFV